MVNYEYTAEMTAWLDGGKSPWHTVEQAKSVLCAEGFEELGLTEPFHAAVGGKYFVESGTFLAAVTVGDGTSSAWRRRTRTGRVCASSPGRSWSTAASCAG